MTETHARPGSRATSRPTPGRVLAAVVAMAFVFGPMGTWAFGLRPDSLENRDLAPTPEVSQGWEALDTLGPWATDRLPIRKVGLRTKAWTDFYLLDTLPRTGQPGALAPRIAGPEGPVLQSPLVIRGQDDHFFYGQDFDRACEATRRFRTGLDRLARVTRLIAESGRTARFSVAPNKSSVDVEHLPDTVPHGTCARRGIAQESRILDEYDDPRYVGVREALDAADEAGSEVYWRTDTHWTTVGSAIYARRIASSLEPDLAASLTSREFERTQVGDLTALLSLTFTETAEAELLDSGAAVLPAPDSEEYDYYGQFPGVQRWTTTGDTAYPGTTTLIGDSFTYYGLENLRPLFAEGRFLWDRNTPDDQDFIDAIVDADTVVISTAQRNVTANKLTRPGFIQRLRTALAANPLT